MSRRAVTTLLASLAVAGLVTACSAAFAVAPPTATPGALIVPDWSRLGFTKVLANQRIAADAGATIRAGAYTVVVPPKTFPDPVRFELLASATVMRQVAVPAGQRPLAAFAFRVMDLATGEITDYFDHPVALTVSNPAITAGAKYFDIPPRGKLTANAKGLQVSPGVLHHPIAGSAVAWLITVPAGGGK